MVKTVLNLVSTNGAFAFFVRTYERDFRVTLNAKKTRTKVDVTSQTTQTSLAHRSHTTHNSNNTLSSISLIVDKFSTIFPLLGHLR